MRIKHSFYILFIITVFCVGALFATGCALKKPGSDNINSQVKVFDVSLFAPADSSAINGVSPRREQCISGYEFYYDDLAIVVSFHNNDRVFRITTRNKKTTMFGIVPGDSFLQAKEKIIRLGFTQSYTPYKFTKDWCLFTLLVDEKNDVFGMTVEVLD
jgi:hypothetical protein